jgi:hypothetical protein
MNITQLPDDILLNIVEIFNSNILYIHMVNKQFNLISYPRIQKEKERVLNKYIFLVEKCKRGIDKCWLSNAFHSVITIEECEFINEVYVPKYGFELFIRQVHYSIGDSYQTTSEIWTKYLIKNKIIL